MGRFLDRLWRFIGQWGLGENGDGQHQSGFSDFNPCTSLADRIDFPPHENIYGNEFAACLELFSVRRNREF